MIFLARYILRGCYVLECIMIVSTRDVSSCDARGRSHLNRIHPKFLCHRLLGK